MKVIIEKKSNSYEINLADEIPKKKFIDATVAPPLPTEVPPTETPVEPDQDPEKPTFPEKEQPLFDPPLKDPSDPSDPEVLPNPPLKKPAILLDIEATAAKKPEKKDVKSNEVEQKTEPPVQPMEEKTSSTNPRKQAFATGRRKSSVARVSLRDGKGWIKINQKPAAGYLQNNTFLLEKVYAPLAFLQLKQNFRISIIVQGGGLMGQADAIKLGICKALCKYDQDYRYPLKLKGYLTRDARVKERKKYGLKKARKAPQYSKR